MIGKIKIILQNSLSNRYALTLAAYLTAAGITGVACVLFMRSFEFVQDHRLDFSRIGAWCWVTTPLLFMLAVELINRAAPAAAGSGIPQAIFAAKHLNGDSEKSLWPLLSSKTMIVKVVAILVGILAGASAGREGPTVHIATCVFIGTMFLFRRVTGFQFDPRSAVVAGGASGLAAAFNTPLAGVTFAIEELTVDYFSSIKDFVLLAIIVAAIAAKSLTGEYAYFGRLPNPSSVPIFAVLLIGIAGGILGAFFSSSLLYGQRKWSEIKNQKHKALLPAALSLVLLAIAVVSQADVLGPGNHAAQSLVRGSYSLWVIPFPLEKIATTLITYWSGIAGGIFAPALSIGSAMGADIGYWMGISTASCALVGMAAFLSGAIQAPITSFVIIFEMTGHHEMLLPIMLASLLAFMVARLLKADHLYQTLSDNYRHFLTSI